MPLIKVLKRPFYTILTVVLAFSFFALNVYIPNLKFLLSSFKDYSPEIWGSLLVSLFQGGLATLPTHSIILLAIMGVLIGLVVSLITYKVRTAKGQSLAGTKYATVGALFGLAAPACAACGIGLLSLIGLGSAAAYLPFQGTEVAVLSIALLAFAVFQLNKSIGECTVCRIDLKKK